MTREELLQIAKPILFNTEMVKAILDGRKTVTRRLVKPKSKNACGFYATFRKSDNAFMGVYDYDENERQFDNSQTPPACIDDILYVRETWSEGYEEGTYIYKADDKLAELPEFKESSKMIYRPSIHMPKEAARIFLKVKDVRVERLQDMSEEEARKEGTPHGPLFEGGDFEITALSKFPRLWNSTIKKADLERYGWEANPWVWVIEFERVKEEQK